jgi:hypothetical protein
MTLASFARESAATTAQALRLLDFTQTNSLKIAISASKLRKSG